MAEIRRAFTFRADPDRVYEALTEQSHLERWWTANVEAVAEEGTTAIFRFEPTGDMVAMVVDELAPGEMVQWMCVDSAVGGTAEWSGTIIRFDLNEGDVEGTTELRLHHSGWKDESDLYRKCDEGWTHFLGTSLKGYLEEGKGDPVPRA